LKKFVTLVDTIVFLAKVCNLKLSFSPKHMENVLFTSGDKWEKVECRMKKWKRNDLLYLKCKFSFHSKKKW